MSGDTTNLTLRHPAFAARFGFARADITPMVEIYSRNWGAAPHDVAKSIHRPLTLNAMVMEDVNSQNRLVLLEGDLSWWRGLDVWTDFQEKLLGAADLPATSLIFSLTHSHASPPLMKSAPDLPGGELLGPWLDTVLESAIDLVNEATSHAQPGVLEWHTGVCRLAHNRDLRNPVADDPPFLCGFNPGVPADDTLLVGRVSDTSGRTRAVLVNYACHPTTLAFDNEALSPDYVGAMREVIEQRVPGAQAMFLQGASGELAPQDQYVSDTAIADRHGEHLGYAALATLADMRPPSSEFYFDGVVESGAPLAIWRTRARDVPCNMAAVRSDVCVPLKHWPSASELSRAADACDDRALKERLRRQLAIRRALGDEDDYPLPWSIWQTGEIIWVGSMAESYSVLQRALREQFPDMAVVCMNLINGAIGYLPPAERYRDDVYQAWQTPFAKGALETAVEQLTIEITELLGDS